MRKYLNEIYNTSKRKKSIKRLISKTANRGHYQRDKVT